MEMETETETEMERESRKRPRVAAAAAEDPSLGAAASAEYAAWLEEMAVHEAKAAEFRKNLLANPLTPEQLREREEAAWEKYNIESWERARDNWIWHPFEAVTEIPCMRFTNDNVNDPNYPRLVRTMPTLQIVSVQVKDITGGLHWPLDVYGFVAVRDVVDRKHIMVFDRERDDYQRISEQDSYLTLTGPTRGVVMTIDPSYLEAKLKVRGATESEDKDLSKFAKTYSLGCYLPIKHTSKLCTLELQHYTVCSSVEATIRVQVIEGQFPRDFRGVLTASTDAESGVMISLLDFNNDELPVDADGSVKLSRQVVSVRKGGKLKVSVWQHGVGEEEDQEITAASFTATEAETSTNYMPMKKWKCWMEVTVAWSLFSCW
ncbi:hypothetical protein CFC21_050475 [Triticum aestivum]|uniref:DUF6598 domain-containing protein n=2 Tax=Triticum aestivum TaxID=4565 RepID=A0A9R1K4H5_WHEAT|nr:uncharacterized protein LOC123080870 [Triticum aestivum]KAF7040584.1 hypothetical protein CFC21_050475 [Triticum aestivum]